MRSQAEKGKAKAQFNLGVMYRDGQDVPQDYSQALAWFRKAAEQGDADAQFALAQMYLDNKGVPEDLSNAYNEYMWLNLAAEQGLEVAINLRNLMESSYSLGQLKAHGSNSTLPAIEEGERLTQQWLAEHPKAHSAIIVANSRMPSRLTVKKEIQEWIQRNSKGIINPVHIQNIKGIIETVNGEKKYTTRWSARLEFQIEREVTDFRDYVYVWNYENFRVERRPRGLSSLCLSPGWEPVSCLFFENCKGSAVFKKTANGWALSFLTPLST